MPRIMQPAIMAAIALGSVVLAGCTQAEPPSPSPTVSESVARSGDGTLTIGTVFSSTGTDAVTGPAQVAGAEVAVREVNEAGGVLGVPVVMLNRDGGDAGTQTLEASLADLTARSVDVIVGPSTSALTQRAIAASAGVPVISIGEIAEPAAGLFTTLASGQARSAAVAGALIDDHRATVAIVASDDDAGAAAIESLSSALDAGGASLATSEATGGADLENRAAAESVADAEPDAVVIATAPESVAAVITALAGAGLTGDRLWTTVPVDLSSALAPGSGDGIRGIVDDTTTDDAFAARVRAADPAVTDLGLAAQAYDAVIVAAITASAVGDDGSASITAAAPDTTVDGVPCSSFAECLDVLTTSSDIDYQGRSGPIDLDPSGRPTAGRFTVVEY